MTSFIIRVTRHMLLSLTYSGGIWGRLDGIWPSSESCWNGRVGSCPCVAWFRSPLITVVVSVTAFPLRFVGGNENILNTVLGSQGRGAQTLFLGVCEFPSHLWNLGYSFLLYFSVPFLLQGTWPLTIRKTIKLNSGWGEVTFLTTARSALICLALEVAEWVSNLAAALGDKVDVPVRTAPRLNKTWSVEERRYCGASWFSRVQTRVQMHDVFEGSFHLC